MFGWLRRRKVLQGSLHLSVDTERCGCITMIRFQLTPLGGMHIQESQRYLCSRHRKIGEGS